MSNAPFMTLISEVLPVSRRDFYMAVPGLLDPNNANPLIDGEWLELNSSYQLARGSGNATNPSWQVFAERGRYDTQAIGKTTVLFIGGYEAETSVCDTTSLVVGSQLIVGDVTVGGLTRRGLKLIPATTGGYFVYGYVTRLPSTGVVRYWRPGSLSHVTV